MDRLGSKLLTKEDLRNSNRLPNWLVTEYNNFKKIVTEPSFPCYFGMSAERRGELRYTYITHDDWSHLPNTLKDFQALFNNKEKFVRHGFFLFVEPESEEKTIGYYRDYFWKVLQYLHDQDEQPWPTDYPQDPDHYLWAFSFSGVPYFAFGNAPAYKQRKTRNLGRSLIIGFQPRVIFNGLEGTSKGGLMSREKVRERVEVWDELPKHPNISHYGDEKHREWKQYFIGDDVELIRGECPFKHK